ncbi:MAG: CoA transferase [SAR202 cluster bacterium]|nr:CoA transferase [SAR202 cluster bacterium]
MTTPSDSATTRNLPLQGVRVLDMTVVWAGPYCATLLADMGAEVIRVESIQTMGPPTRAILARPPESVIKNAPAFAGGLPNREVGNRPWNRHPLFNAHARNKLSMTVDLLRSEGKDIFKRMVAISDVLVENNPTETMEKLGISYDELHEINPGFIMLRMPAYGNDGPYQNHRSLGVHIEGVIGHTLMRGYTDMDPSTNTQVYMADAAAGAGGALAVATALNYRRLTGKGQRVELSQAENALPYLGGAFMDYSMNGRNASTLGNRHPTAIQGLYPCAGDDRWLAITIFDERDWELFCEAIGNPDWVSESRFTDHASRRANHDALDANISEWTSQQTNREAMEVLQSHGVASGTVLNQKDAAKDPQYIERGMFEEAFQEDVGTYRYPRAPFKMSHSPVKIRRGPVRLGEDNEYVYKTLLQLSDEEYDHLVDSGHIGMDYAPHIK